ncbi:MAG TPA: TRAP transporter large permease subunit [Burkholderiales bacterium]|nr:TRAP transporter large permease subunit [Burkholderiales bacterium]
MRKELWFGFTLMGLLLLGLAIAMPSPADWTLGHYGLLMLALIVVAIMLGFPTAFTLMGMGVIFAWFAYRAGTPDNALRLTLDLMVQRTYAVMTNEVLIAVPLFVFMGYLVERANLIEKLFKSLHLALSRLPGSLAVATVVTCAIFATATGIVGAVVTLMGLLAFPAMLRAGYNVSLSAGAITAGGCLGILIPPSVLLIVYGATAGVSVVQLYAGAFFPGLLLAGLYVFYIIFLAKWRPRLAPPLSDEERIVPLSPEIAKVRDTTGQRAVPSLVQALTTKVPGAPTRTVANHLIVALLPAAVFLGAMGLMYDSLTTPAETYSTEGLVEMGGGWGFEDDIESSLDLAPPPGVEATELGGETPTDEVTPSDEAETDEGDGALEAPKWFWITLACGLFGLFAFYVIFDFARLEIFKMLLTSFFPLAVLILAVLGSIVFGFATPSEAAAVGGFGGFALAAFYLLVNEEQARRKKIMRLWLPLWAIFFVPILWFAFADDLPPEWLGITAACALGLWLILATVQVRLTGILKESVYLTAKTSAMVCWLFVGSSIFSAAFALLGGQELVERWVLGMDLTPIQFMLMAQVIIFLLGWPLEWTEIIVIFMPIFIPLLPHFGIDPLFFGLLVALNLQTAFLSPPVAMSAFYLKGVAPPHVTLNQIFYGMLPYMAIQIFAMFLLYMFPGIGLWLPEVLYS